MAPIAAVAFFAAPLFLILYYSWLTRDIMQTHSRLHMTLPVLGELPDAFHRPATEPVEVYMARAKEWLRFTAEYTILVTGLLAMVWLWVQYEETLIRLIEALVTNGILLPLDFGTGAAWDSFWFPLLILAGVLPAWLIFRTFFLQSAVYPFLFVHLILLTGAALADILQLNVTLETTLLSRSALGAIIWLIFASHVVWALTYPAPLKALPLVLCAMASSLLIALGAFTVVEIILSVHSPTLTSFAVYTIFGYGAFGMHLWSVAFLSRTVA